MILISPYVIPWCHLKPKLRVKTSKRDEWNCHGQNYIFSPNGVYDLVVVKFDVVTLFYYWFKHDTSQVTHD